MVPQAQPAITGTTIQDSGNPLMLNSTVLWQDISKRRLETCCLHCPCVGSALLYFWSRAYQLLWVLANPYGSSWFDLCTFHVVAVGGGYILSKEPCSSWRSLSQGICVLHERIWLCFHRHAEIDILYLGALFNWRKWSLKSRICGFGFSCLIKRDLYFCFISSLVFIFPFMVSYPSIHTHYWDRFQPNPQILESIGVKDLTHRHISRPKTHTTQTHAN